MGWLRTRRIRRVAADGHAVMAAITMLRPWAAHGWPIICLSRIGSGRTYAALDRLVRAGQVIREDDPDGSARALYRLATSADH